MSTENNKDLDIVALVGEKRRLLLEHIAPVIDRYIICQIKLQQMRKRQTVDTNAYVAVIAEMNEAEDALKWTAENFNYETESLISPPKKPLFTTEDGVDTYQDQDCWVVRQGVSGGWNLHNWAKVCKEGMKDGEKYFHFYINAEAWVEAQKPKVLFTTEEGMEVTDPEQIILYVSQFKIRERKAKNACALNNKRFARRDAAERYVLENKPVLSVRDVWSLTAKYGYDMMALENDVINLAKEKL